MPDRFKTPLNKPEGITPEDYVRARNYVEAIKAIVQIAYESIYIIAVSYTHLRAHKTSV